MKRVKRSYNSTVEDQPLQNLPSEMVAEILARLPPKSILAFRRVCKSWYSLLSKPFFASKQLALSQYVATKSRNYLILHHKNDLYAVPAEDCLRTASLKPRKLNFPSMEAAKSPFSVKGSSNGLLCFSVFEKFLLWNPLIGRVKEIPKSQSQLRTRDEKVLLGFGFVSQTCDYKLVSIEDKVHHGFPKFETCSLRNPTWMTRTSIVDNNFDYQIVYTSKRRFCFPCVKSNLYFIARKRNRGSTEFDRIIVLRFDMLEEKFREIPLPNNANYDADARGCHVIGEYNGTIALFVTKKEFWVTWVMKEDGNNNNNINNNVRCKWATVPNLHPFPSSILYTISGKAVTKPFEDLLVIWDSESWKKTLIPLESCMVVYKEISLALLDDGECRN